MPNSSLRKADELTPRLREALEAFLGRTLQPNESVSVRTYLPKKAPDGEERGAAYRHLFDSADSLAGRVKDIPEAEIDAAIDEAADFVRHNPE